MSDLAPALAVIGMILAFGWIIRSWIGNRSRLRMAKMRTDVQSKMLDKFASTPDLATFLESEAGRRFVESTTTEKVGYHQRILGSVQSGLILAVVGVALLMLDPRFGGSDQAFLFLGTLGLALGVGFLLAAGAAYLLSKRWGLINGGDRVEWSRGPAENPID